MLDYIGSMGLLNFYREDVGERQEGDKRKEKRNELVETNEPRNGQELEMKEGPSPRRRLAIRRSDKLNQLTHLPTYV